MLNFKYLIFNLREDLVKIDYNNFNNAYHSDFSESVGFFSFSEFSL